MDIVCLDFSKAFDAILTDKLMKYRLDNQMYLKVTETQSSKGCDHLHNVQLNIVSNTHTRG